MRVTRRHFLKGIGGLMAAGGLLYREGTREVNAAECKIPKKGKVGITWLGHGSFLFESVKGQHIMLDPWIKTNPKCPVAFRDQNMLSHVDLVLWTHGHVDHFMLSDAREIIGRYHPKVVAPWELSFFIKSQIPEADCQTFTLANKGATANFDGIKVTMTEAYHSAGAQLTGFEGVNKFVGEAAGYVIEFENGFKIYHSGDTALMGDMKNIIGEYYRPHLAILPIGGAYTMGPKEAAYACKLINPKYVIPEHYGTFPILAQSPASFLRELKHRAPHAKPFAISPGERIKV